MTVINHHIIVNFVDENTLTVNISRLRAKLEDYLKKPQTIKIIQERRGIGMALAVTIIISIALCFLTVLLSYRYVRETFDSVEWVLDNILTRNAELPFEVAADSRLSKLTHKAVKIIQMNTMDISQTKQEKEIIQSFLSDMSLQMKTPLSDVAMWVIGLSCGDLLINNIFL